MTNPDASILKAMRRAGDSGVSGADLAQQLGISRAAIWARIEELRQLGYNIQASPHHGYQLLDSPDLLHADDLLSRLDDIHVVGRDIRVFEETGSTNDVADKLARDGVAEGVVIIAESQTKGRGRLGRKWVSAHRKGLWFSVLLRPPLRPQSATQFTAAAAIALSRAIQQEAGIHAQIKWPNDLIIGNKKIAGILTEMNAELDRIKSIVVGIGVNVNHDIKDLPEDIRDTATSLAIESRRKCNRAALAAALIKELDKVYASICKHQFTAIADEWERECITLGHHVRIVQGQTVIEGVAETLDDDGALLVRTQHGRLTRIIGGDVTLRRK